MDKARLIKVLALTTSPNDSEALAAIRKANDIIAGEQLTWEALLQSDPSVVISITHHRYPTTNANYAPAEEWTPPHLKDPAIIDHMFRAIYAKLTPETEFAGWVDSVHNHWEKYKQVTPRQYEGLRRSYTRASK